MNCTTHTASPLTPRALGRRPRAPRSNPTGLSVLKRAACCLAALLSFGFVCSEDEKPLTYPSLMVAYREPFALCERAHACDLTLERECLEAVPSERAIIEALRSLDWGSASQERCLRAVEDEDRCLLELSCEDMAVAWNSVWFDGAWSCWADNGEDVPCPPVIPCGPEMGNRSVSCRDFEALAFSSTTCTPGVTRDCAIAGASCFSGVQSCLADGSGYSSCECP